MDIIYAIDLNQYMPVDRIFTSVMFRIWDIAGFMDLRLCKFSSGKIRHFDLHKKIPRNMLHLCIVYKCLIYETMKIPYSRDSAVGIATGYAQDNRGVGVSARDPMW
jgi:hypothetical protein